MTRRSLSLVLSLVATSALLTVGCSAASDEDVGSDEGAIKPASPQSLQEQRLLCDSRVKENGALRDADLKAGVVRWKCGDVKGVDDGSGPKSNGVNDLGQEYCEFHAVQEGLVVDKVAKSKIKPAKVECVFTGVYRDVKGEPGGAENKKYGELLNAELIKAGANNLKDAKAAPAALGPNPFSVMNGRFNGRIAATQLLSDCQGAARDADFVKRVGAAADDVKCDSTGASCASARDIEACTSIVGKGEGWRNSDPVICGRAARGALCGASYGALPAALEGFIMTDWNADLKQAVEFWAGKTDKAPSAPDGCRYATVNGKPYLHIILCTPTAAQVNKPQYEGRLQQMCTETFGAKIAMTAPIGLVSSGAKDSPGFCTDFNKGTKAIQSFAAPAAKN